jgi:MFS family permease
MTMERNLRLYPAYQAARSATFWLPVFFLYFSSRLDVADVLLLESIYYAAVVAFEVPSGYLSDRVGRRPTLVLAAIAWTAGYVALALGGSWWVFATGQVAVAAGMALNSGTDSAMLFDSLASLGRDRELATLEGRARGWGAIAMAGSALIGGAVAAIDLRLGHGLSALGAVAAIGLAWGFREPPRRQVAARPLQQLRDVGAALRKPALLWVFAFAVAMTVFNHVPYELAQPYLRLVLAQQGIADFTPVASGVMMAVMMAAAAVASRWAARLGDRLGVAPIMLGAMVLQGVVLAGLAAVVHPAIVGLLLLRSVPGALTRPLQLQCVLPNIDAHLRATYLSVQSLAGRLAFTSALAAGAWAVGGIAQMGADAVSWLAGAALVMLAAVVAALALARGALAEPSE